MVSVAGKRVAIYARFSSDKQNDASIDDQVHRASEWLRTHGADPDSALILSDRAVSGASMDRPGMRALLAAVERGEVQVVVTESVDRISRDAHDALGFRKTLAYKGVDLECLDGTRIGGTDKNSLLMYGLRSMLGEQYLADLADKTRRGQEGRARGGKAAGRSPFGYRHVQTDAGVSIEIDPERAPIVRRIFELYAAGFSFAVVAAALNADGIPPPRPHSRKTGTGWMVSAVREILLNDRYHGVWMFGEREWRKVPGTNRRISRARAGGALVTMERPELALVDEQLWLEVQARFASHKTPELKQARRRYMLSGIATCGVCGGVMTVHGGSATHRYYGCSNARKRGPTVCANRANLEVRELERTVVRALHIRFLHAIPRVLELLAEEERQWARVRPDRSEDARRRIREIESKLDNLVDTLAATGSRAIGAKVTELEAQRIAARAELATLEGAAPTAPTSPELAERLRVIERLLLVPPDTAREALRRLLEGGRVECIPLDDGSYDARWTILPSAFTGTERQTQPGAGASGCVSMPVVAGARIPQWRNIPGIEVRERVGRKSDQG